MPARGKYPQCDLVCEIDADDVADQDHPADAKANPQMSEKQKRLVEQTDKLVQLATDLKAQVAKSNKDTLSIQVIKKADEIEKLAHSMKDQMKS